MPEDKYSSKKRILLKHSNAIIVLLRQYPLRSIVVLTVMFVAGVLESIGLLTLLPLLEVAINGNSNAGSKVASYFYNCLSFFSMEKTIGVILTIIVVLIVFKSILSLLAMNYIGGAIARMATELRMDLTRSILSARWSFFLEYPLGRFINALTKETTEATSTYRATCQFIAAFFQSSLMLVAAFLISPYLTAMALVVGFFMAFLLGRFVGLARKSGHEMVRLMQEFSSHLTDALQGIKPLKAMNCERFLIPIFEKKNYELDKTIRQQVLAKYGLSLLREPIVVIVLAFGMYYVLSFAKIPFAELLTMVVLFHRSVAYIGLVQQAYQQVRASEHYYWSVQELIGAATEQKEDLLPKERPEFIKNIKFDSVSFSYGDTNLFKNLTFELPALRFYALVGPSGAGKTTLSDILCGLYSVSSGLVLIDGKDFDEIDIQKWRQIIGYVPQDLFLFHDTIFNNITLGDPRIDRETVMQSVSDAGAAEFVGKLDDGVDTIIGERGLKLSGGQRQRIAIARALVRKPRLLIFDEATTALDPETEKEILLTLKLLAKKITILAISHQEQVVSTAEKIFRLENGKLIQIR